MVDSLIINSVDNPSNTYFEWGTSESLGNQTPVISVGSLPSAKHINTITGLAPKTTYYFRAVLENSSGRINGAILNFATNNVASQSNIVEKNTTNTVITNTSLIQPEKSTSPVNLGANVFSSGSLLPVSILGWFTLIILILVLILLSKHLYHKLSNKKEERPQEHV